MATFDCLAFDADDTLWHSEDGFRATELAFYELLAPFAPTGIDIKAALTATERANLHTYGYGVKAFGLSMVEAAITISQGQVPTEVLAHLIQLTRDLLLAPVRLLDGVPEVAAAILNKKVRTGGPLRLAGLADSTGGPAFSAAAGLLSFAVHHHAATQAQPASTETQASRIGRIGSWIRDNF